MTYGAALAAYIGEVLPSLGIEGRARGDLRRLGGAGAARGDPLAARHGRRRAPSPPSPASRATRRCCTSSSGSRRRTPGKRDLARGRRAVGRPAHRPRRACWRCCATRPRCRSSERDIVEAHRIMVDRVAAIVARDPRERRPSRRPRREGRRDVAGRSARRRDRGAAAATCTGPRWASSTSPASAPSTAISPRGCAASRARTATTTDDDQNIRGETGIDGLRTEDDPPLLDLDDVAILLRANQLAARGEAAVRAPVRRRGAGSVAHEAVGADRPHRRRRGAAGKPANPSITLAGDTSQRLFLDNGFGDWRGVLGHLALAHVAVEPLRIAYRSTREILALARAGDGPARRRGRRPRRRAAARPVEAFRFPAAGAAVAFLAEALRDLAAREPRATVALLARHPEQADRYLRRPAPRRGPRAAPGARPGVRVPPRRRGDRRPPGQGARVRLRRDARRERQQLRPRRRVAPPVPHRRHPRRAPALAGRDRRRRARSCPRTSRARARPGSSRRRGSSRSRRWWARCRPGRGRPSRPRSTPRWSAGCSGAGSCARSASTRCEPRRRRR